MSIPYINFSTSNHTGLILGAQQSIQRRMNIRPDWTELRCVAMARVVGGSTIDSGIANLNANISPVNFSIVNPTSPSQKFFFGIKDSSYHLPESNSSKFIGIGAGETSNITFTTGYTGSSYPMNTGGQNQNYGIKFGSGMRYGITNGANILSTLKAPTANTTPPNNRFQPAIKEWASGTEPTLGFCSSVGFIIKVLNRGSEEQQVTIFNYGSQVYNSNNPAYSVVFRVFSDLSETVLDSEMNVMATNINANSGELRHTFNAPHSQWDLSDINSFYLYWPFTNNRLILFNLKVKDFSL